MEKMIVGAMGVMVLIWMINRMKPNVLPSSFKAFLPPQTVV